MNSWTNLKKKIEKVNNLTIILRIAIILKYLYIYKENKFKLIKIFNKTSD